MIKIKKFLHRYIYPIFIYCFPINNNKVVFSSFAGKQYSDNPRAISEELYKKNPRVEIVWLINNARKVREGLPNYVKLVENESFLAAYELYTAKVWVDNCRKPLFFKKRKKQIYMQTWHGTPLKVIEADAGNKLGKKYRKYAKRDTRNMDLLISGNEYSTKIFKRAFKFEGEVLECGTPRNDLLINRSDEIGLKVRKKLRCEGKKIIMFAPTFRNELTNNGLPQLEKLKPNAILDAYEKKYQKKCILLLRLHPNVAKQIDKDIITAEYDGRIIDVSQDWDMQELLCATDALITDYSSVFFDYSILRRPIFIFIPDKREYMIERGLYFDIEKLPICSAETSEKLISQFFYEEDDKLVERTVELLDLIGNKETGKASLKLTEYIIGHINK